MIYTNRGELPAPLYRALTAQTYQKVGDVSVTELIKSPRQRLLAKRHDKEIVVDASDNLWSVMGTAVHDLMVKHSDKVNGIAEERFSVKIHGPVSAWTLSGEVDLIEDIGDGVLCITDYKFVGLFSYILEKKRGGVKEEWEQQLNMYRWLVWKAMGWDIKLLKISFIARDWMESKVGREADYPQQGTFMLDVPVWPLDRIEAFVLDRVAVHQAAEKKADEFLPECSPKERWERPGTWAVMKPGKQRAEKVCDSAEEAEAFAKDIKGGTVQHRRGASNKCNPKYCHGQPWCNQANPTVING